MSKLSAFADEIDDDPKLQLDCMEANDVRFIELRGAWGVNVMKLSAEQRSELKTMFADRGFGVACIASPIGKVTMEDDYKQHFDDFKHAVDLADEFDSKYIRIFSYYPPEGKNIADYQDEIIRRLKQKADFAKDRDVTLVLENESKIFGDTPERCKILLEALSGTALTAAFDPANFVHCGVENVYENCWKPLRGYVGYFHMKDWKYGNGDGPGVPVGTGDGHIPQILADAAQSGFDGFLALEPHLAAGGQFGGKTGPDLFKTATDALKMVCAEAGLALD